MLIDDVFVSGAGVALSIAVPFGIADGDAAVMGDTLGIAVRSAEGLADGLALGRGVGVAAGRTANAGGSALGVSMRRSTVRA
ncbi:MAG: hypothetical protein E6J38_13380 [Chloroflexi bacterium]|nr:MAG: hypothetical protein E6J38_13380 [Chloroflexota bacterium]